MMTLKALLEPAPDHQTSGAAAADGGSDVAVAGVDELAQAVRE